MKHKGIREIFTKYGKKDFEIWLSGKEGFGELMSWYRNGQQFEHTFYSDKGKLVGVRRVWTASGEVLRHEIYDTKGKRIKVIA
jgi:antitoxin component YwqK of YwqJK toxin-antitoxin module